MKAPNSTVHKFIENHGKELEALIKDGVRRYMDIIYSTGIRYVYNDAYSLYEDHNKLMKGELTYLIYEFDIKNPGKPPIEKLAAPTPAPFLYDTEIIGTNLVCFIYQPDTGMQIDLSFEITWTVTFKEFLFGSTVSVKTLADVLMRYGLFKPRYSDLPFNQRNIAVFFENLTRVGLFDKFYYVRQIPVKKPEKVS